MVDEEMISKMTMASCNFCASIPEGIAWFRKRMQKYEVFSKKREAMKASMAALKKEKESFAEKELAWQKKVHELTQRHEVEIGKLKQQAEASVKEKDKLEASLAQLAKDNKWLIDALGDVYSKLLIHGRHQGYTVGYDAGAAGSLKDKSPLFQPGVFEVFKNTVVKMEHLTYSYVGEVSECYGKPLSVLQGSKPRGLNEAVCDEVLKSISKKRPHSGERRIPFLKAGMVRRIQALKPLRWLLLGERRGRPRRLVMMGVRRMMLPRRMMQQNRPFLMLQSEESIFDS
ncbi:hypothetical protein HanPSC8_Chr07g0274301 [Helianthus annuus]|nr:hypothetical protein HanPSC8_Chr07g0274301 [Helianthus annuus]